MKIWCPWCRQSYEVQPLDKLWACDICNDTFWHADVTSFTLEDVNILMKALTKNFPKDTNEVQKLGGGCWINVLDRWMPSENVDHLLIAFDDIYMPTCEIHSEKFQSYVDTGAITTVTFSAQGAWDTGLTIEEMYRKNQTPGDFLHVSDVWLDEKSDYREFEDCLRKLSCICASAMLKTLKSDMARGVGQDVRDRYSQEEQLAAVGRISVGIYNYFRQMLLGELLDMTTTSEVIIGASTSQWLSGERVIEQARSAQLVEVLFDEAAIVIPSDLSADDVLDFRVSKACRRLRATLRTAIREASLPEEQRKLVLSDFKHEAKRLEDWTRRFGKTEEIAISALGSAGGYAMGGLAGAIVGGASGPALSGKLGGLTQNLVGRVNWARFFKRP